MLIVRNWTLVTLFSLLVPTAAYAQTSAPAAVRDTRPPGKRPTEEERQHPPKSWIDAKTGHRITRLTDEPGSASFYFNVNAYTPDNREMIYTFPDGIGVLDLQTHKTREVVHGRVHTIVVGHKTPSVFYIKPEENALYVTNVDTGATRKLVNVPPRANIATVNADETLAAGTYEEGPQTSGPYQHETGARQQSLGPKAAEQTSPIDTPPNKGEMMVRRLAARIPLVLYTIDLQSGEVTQLLHSTDWINHLLFSPADSQLLMYCHEGPWQAVDRIWTIHTDGTHNELMHKRTMDMEIAGHEFWGQGGDIVYYDLQTPKGQDFWLASLDLNSGKRTWYHMDRNEWSIHFNVNEKLNLYTGDGGDPGQVAKAPDGEWLYIFHPELTKQIGISKPEFINPGVLHAEKLANMSKHNYYLEPNVRLTPDGSMVIFRSNMFGPTYVFGVETAKAK